MEEILEIMTWSQLGIHKKPIALLNTLYYFENLLKFFKHATEEQFLKKEYLDQLIISEHPEQLIKQMSNYEPRQIDKLFSKPSL